jgi:hypothetical protein
MLQQPVILLDACGKIAPFHLEFVDSLEAFVAVMREGLHNSKKRSASLHAH